MVLQIIDSCQTVKLTFFLPFVATEMKSVDQKVLWPWLLVRSDLVNWYVALENSAAFYTSQRDSIWPSPVVLPCPKPRSSS